MIHINNLNIAHYFFTSPHIVVHGCQFIWAVSCRWAFRLFPISCYYKQYYSEQPCTSALACDWVIIGMIFLGKNHFIIWYVQFHFGYRLPDCIPKRLHLFYISINNVWSDLFSNLYIILNFYYCYAGREKKICCWCTWNIFNYEWG